MPEQQKAPETTIPGSPDRSGPAPGSPIRITEKNHSRRGVKTGNNGWRHRTLVDRAAGAAFSGTLRSTEINAYTRAAHMKSLLAERPGLNTPAYPKQPRCNNPRSTATTFTDTGTDADTLYVYQVRAQNSKRPERMVQLHQHRQVDWQPQRRDRHRGRLRRSSTFSGYELREDSGSSNSYS